MELVVWLVIYAVCFAAPIVLARLVWTRTSTTAWPRRGIQRSLALATLMLALIPLGWFAIPAPVGSTLLICSMFTMLSGRTDRKAFSALTVIALSWYLFAVILLFTIAWFRQRRKRTAAQP